MPDQALADGSELSVEFFEAVCEEAGSNQVLAGQSAGRVADL